MAYQNIFKRYELKYLMTRVQRDELMDVMEPHMKLDNFGHATIRNIYFDTDSFRLIRRSIEKPAYKEKLRVRSYGKAGETDTVFVELKKKYDSVVYKRRIDLPEAEAMRWLTGQTEAPKKSQIASEIDYFLGYYDNLAPAVFLSYEREAYAPTDGLDFRVTLDENIRSRRTDVSLGAEIYGDKIIDDGQVLMEIKTPGGIPLWMTQFLSRNHLYKTSFSKYGTAYKKYIAPQMIEEREAERYEYIRESATNPDRIPLPRRIGLFAGAGAPAYAGLHG